MRRLRFYVIISKKFPKPWTFSQCEAQPGSKLEPTVLPMGKVGGEETFFRVEAVFPCNFFEAGVEFRGIYARLMEEIFYF